MSIDLKTIANDNLRKYGTEIDRYGPVLLAHLYSDRTHFIFELLQNAEDAGATEFEFHLHPDRLEVRHNGRPFNEDDVRGICGLVEATKSEDYTKIGRFGIGFKSVYAYTCSPEIHSTRYHFRIKNYVIPEAISGDISGDDLTTFVFPFDHREVTPEDSHDEIMDGLTALDLRTLLFLKQLEVLRWFDGGESHGQYVRRSRNRKSAQLITLEAKTKEGSAKERWLVFRKAVVPPEISIQRAPPAYIEAAYRVEKNKAGEDQIVPINYSPLIVFFKTEKETDLGFLIQGPYVTTPARDNVPEKQEWNITLVSETAVLVVDSLQRLKEMGFLSVRALACLPLDEVDFPEGSMFRPIFDTVRAAIANEELIPARGGGFTSGRNSVLARGADMVKLFNPRRLKKLLEFETTPKWLSTEITENRTPTLHRYLTTKQVDEHESSEASFQVPEIRPETIAEKLSEEFMMEQTEPWVRQLYLYFVSKQELISILREAPILKTQRGKYVAAVDENGAPLVFLPSKNSSGYATVKKSLIKDPAVLEFFRSLGLTEPNLTSEVLRKVLPKYRAEAGGKVGGKEHREDIEMIVSSLRSGSGLERELDEALKGTPFLRGENTKTKRRAYMKPSDLYRSTPELLLYFEGNSSAWFLSEADEYESQFLDLGVKQSVESNCREPGIDGHVQVLAERRNFQRGLDGFDPECTINGLDHALKTPTLEKANFIWNELLIPLTRSIRGTTQRAQWHTYRHATDREVYSPMGELVTETPWLPDGKEGFSKPEDLCADDLPDSFVRSQELIKNIRMRPAGISVLAEEVGLPVEFLDELRKEPDLFQEFLSWKSSVEEKIEEEGWEEDEEPAEASEPEHPRRVRDELSIAPPKESVQGDGAISGKVRDGDTDSEESGSEESFAALLNESFNRSGEFTFPKEENGFEDDGEVGIVKNPERRAAKLAKRIRDNFADEPIAAARRSTVERTLLEASDPAVRAKLFEWYHGKCQICERTWPERNGDPYFVSAYLVERKHARALDDPANAICLCAEHFAQWKLAARKAPKIIEQIQDLALPFEGGKAELCLRFRMFEWEFTLKYCEQHLLALKQLLEVSAEP